MTQDVSLLDTSKAARFFLSNGVVVTGSHTGVSASVDELKTLKDALDFPVLVGSGITIDNVATYLPICDAMIVGSYFKDGGYWENDLSYERISKLMEIVNKT